MDAITTQFIANKYIIHMDLKVSTLKPNICGWLHSIGLHVAIKPKMVLKGWKQT
jgi:hypothetical protein